MKYWIERWSQLRKKELIEYPGEFPINDVYTAVCTSEEIQSGFAQLHSIFDRCYEDILNDPAGMLLPVYDMDEYGYFSKEARTSREMSYKYAKLFYVLGYSGELRPDGGLFILSDIFKEQCKAHKITSPGALIEILGNYGFFSGGLIKGKIKSNSALILYYPDNKNVINVLHHLAVKAKNTDRFIDFCRLNYRLLAGDLDTVGYGEGIDYVADILHSEQERKAALLIHGELVKRGFCYNFQDWNEGPQIRYYKKESDRKRNTNATFWLASMDAQLQLFFRIQDIEKALTYIETCPESVIGNFTVSDPGCGNRLSGKCVSGISYELGGNTVWRCGCCNPNFRVTPNERDYLYYINAADMAVIK